MKSSLAMAAGGLVMDVHGPVLLLSSVAMGGSERQGYLLARALAERALRPTVIVWTSDDSYYGKAIEDLGIPLLVPPQTNWLAKARWLRAFCASRRPPILHSFAFYLNAVAAWAMRGLPGSAIGAIRAEYAFEASVGYVHYSANRRWPSCIMANSLRACEEARADHGLFRPRQIRYLPNGIDLDLHTVRRHAPTSCARLVGVGSLYIEKRWDRLLRVLAEVKARAPQLRFLAEVAGRRGGEYTKLVALVDQLGLSEQVSFLGMHDNVPALLAVADVFVFTSDTEGTPNAVMEAMASGLPILATDAGDVPSLVEDGVHGFIVERNDERSFADRLIALLSDADLRARMGSNSRGKAEAEFGLEGLLTHAINAYEDLGWHIR